MGLNYFASLWDFDRTIFDKLSHADNGAFFREDAGIDVPGSNPYQLKRLLILQLKLGLWGFKLLLLRVVLLAKLESLYISMQSNFRINV
ncbi:MAG TPA: hypothetical protein VN379_15665 [Sporomusa sp.]|nr:hypothetical protein [Sporomusa sp.]